MAEADSPVLLGWSRALAAECALRCLHPLTELGSHLTVVPEVVAEPGVPANAALVVAATLEVQLVGGFKQRVQLDRRRRGAGPLSAALALRVALVFATALSLGFAFAPPLARGSGLAFARPRAIAFLTFPFAFLAGRPKASKNCRSFGCEAVAGAFLGLGLGLGAGAGLLAGTKGGATGECTEGNFLRSVARNVQPVG